MTVEHRKYGESCVTVTTECPFCGFELKQYGGFRITGKGTVLRIPRTLIEPSVASASERDLDLPDDDIDIEVLASEENVEPAALKKYLDETYPGFISGGIYLPEAVIK